MDEICASEYPNEILIIGVGEDGIKAVNYLSGKGIERADYWVVDTDKQSVSNSPVKNKILFDPHLPIDLCQEFSNQISVNYWFSKKIVFVISGLEDNLTIPLSSRIANHWKDEYLVLTIGIATLPLLSKENSFREQAITRLDIFQQCTDSLIIIDPDIVSLNRYNKELSEWQTTDYYTMVAIRSFTDLVVGPCYLEYRYSDIYNFARNGSRGFITAGEASGGNRKKEAVRRTLSSPAITRIDLGKVKNILLSISYGSDEIELTEISDIVDSIFSLAHADCNFIWNFAIDPQLDDILRISILGIGLNTF